METQRLGARPQGLGFLHYKEAEMTSEEAQAILDGGQTYFDYLQGRVMKINLSAYSFDPWGYDRDNGEGAAARVIDALRTSSSVNNEVIQDLHRQGRLDAAQQFNEASSAEPFGGTRSCH